MDTLIEIPTFLLLIESLVFGFGQDRRPKAESHNAAAHPSSAVKHDKHTVRSKYSRLTHTVGAIFCLTFCQTLI